MISKCGRGSRNTAWRGADPYSIPLLPYGVYGDRLTFTFYLCYYKQSPAYVVSDNAMDLTTEESWSDSREGQEHLDRLWGPSNFPFSGQRRLIPQGEALGSRSRCWLPSNREVGTSPSRILSNRFRATGVSLNSYFTAI